MLRRRAMSGRRGPSLIGTAARTAVVAGTATAVAGKVSGRQASRQQAAQPQAAPAPAAPAPADDLPTQLQRLADLKAGGLLTDDEFDAAKARLLSPG
jgi:hypothetical protein